MVSTGAIAAIVVAVIVVVAGAVVGTLFGLKVIKIKKAEPVAESTTAATTPDAATPDAATLATTPVTPPPPPNPALLYVDRGCWRDGGYQYGQSDSWDRQSDYNRALGLNNVIDLNTVPNLVTDQDYFDYGVKKAMEGRFDTFAFQNGNELRLGNYQTDISPVPADGIVYKYDKFGPATGTCSYRGGPWINHVFSIVPPNKTTKKAADYVDRGCWPDFTPGRNVSKSWIDMNQVGIPRSEWYNWALQKAIEGNHDTFSFQADFALFLGNYNSVYRYDKGGQRASACSEFGPGGINKVYSTVPPALPSTTSRMPGNKATANVTTSAAQWLRK